jgi:pimeloyl-ACP methyl ester carboxylesterase
MPSLPRAVRPLALAASLLILSAPRGQGAPDDLPLHPTLDFYSTPAREIAAGVRPWDDRFPGQWDRMLKYLPPRPPVRGTAYFIAGWSNDAGILLAPDKARDHNVYLWLAERGIDFKLCWWNSRTRKRPDNPGPVPYPFKNAELVREMAAEINGLPKDHLVVLIGHSFGAETILRIARRVERRIDFIGVLDPTGRMGSRGAALRRPVPSNVRYFWNRWQTSGAPPFDFKRSGELKLESPQTISDQRNGGVGGLFAHQGLYTSGKIKRDIVVALEKAFPAEGLGIPATTPPAP